VLQRNVRSSRMGITNRFTFQFVPTFIYLQPMGLKRTVIDGIRSVAPPSAFNHAKRLYHRLVDLTVRPRIAEHVYGGVPLSVCVEGRGAEAWYDHDWPELREIQQLSKGKLRSGATVFDIGAHHAIVAMMLAHTVGPDGNVIAVEANARYAAMAQKNIALNHIENVILIEAAAASESGKLSFTPDSDAVDRAEPGMGTTTVKAVSVDDLAALFGSPDVLFIDVEGYECEVLRGATETLQERPDLFVEVHVGAGLEAFGYSAADVLKSLPSDYEVCVAPPDGEFRPLADAGDVMKDRFFLVAQSATSNPPRS
jgi:FkbM family methyltransferase